MEKPEILRREIKALAFDQYGTIVDMQQGLTAAVAPFLKQKGWRGEPNSFVTWWRRTHFESSMIDALCDRGHTPYRQIGHRAISYVMDRCGIAYTQGEVRSLVAEIEKLKPFPDVLAALERLRSNGYELAILSNGDRDMLNAAGPHIGFRFDHVISVEEAGYFKPHWKTYAKAAEIIGEDRSSILFVANHAFDCIGAKSYGMRTAFIDRRQRPFGQTPHQPDFDRGGFRGACLSPGLSHQSMNAADRGRRQCRPCRRQYRHRGWDVARSACGDRRSAGGGRSTRIQDQPLRQAICASFANGPRLRAMSAAGGS
jgi:2-haloacid dehalogenase